jgi:hypothetical protein
MSLATFLPHKALGTGLWARRLAAPEIPLAASAGVSAYGPKRRSQK